MTFLMDAVDGLGILKWVSEVLNTIYWCWTFGRSIFSFKHTFSFPEYSKSITTNNIIFFLSKSLLLDAIIHCDVKQVSNITNLLFNIFFNYYFMIICLPITINWFDIVPIFVHLDQMENILFHGRGYFIYLQIFTNFTFYT